MSEPPFATVIEARPDSFGARRALGGAGPCRSPRSQPGSRRAPIHSGRDERWGGVGGHFGAPHINWSGRPASNRRRPAWGAGILPLNYGRLTPPILLRDAGRRRRLT